MQRFFTKLFTFIGIVSGIIAIYSFVTGNQSLEQAMQVETIVPLARMTFLSPTNPPLTSTPDIRYMVVTSTPPQVDLPTQIQQQTTGSNFNPSLNNWSRVSPNGSWRTTADGLIGNVGSGTDSFYLANNSITNFELEATFVITAGQDNASAGVLFRSQRDPLQGSYMVRVTAYGDGNGQINFVRFYTSGTTVYYPQPAIIHRPIRLNTPYTIRIVANGNNFAVYLNDEWMFDVTDSNYSRGAIGLIVNGSTTRFTAVNIR